MNKAKEYAQGLMDNAPRTEEERIERISDFAGTAVNDLCQSYLPQHLTIGQSAIIHATIMDMICDPEKYLKP